jgi:hypothetical protein
MAKMPAGKNFAATTTTRLQPRAVKDAVKQVHLQVHLQIIS